MKELREIIAKNILNLRTKQKITQFHLAQTLNYSDKAVSKWERAESVPDVTVLKQIADFFGVTVDYLLTEDHSAHTERTQSVSAAARHHRFIISALSVSLVWFIAVFAFVVVKLSPSLVDFPGWLVFLYAAPISMIIVLIFNTIWGNRRFNFLVISLMIWLVLASVYVSFVVIEPHHNFWAMFFLGIPAQLIIILWSGLRSRTQ